MKRSDDEVIDRNLRMVSELRNLCISLGRSKPVSLPEESPEEPKWDREDKVPLSARTLRRRRG
jgi:hypothetical protein